MANSNNQTDDHIAHTHQKRRILGIAVLSVTAVIVCLWGFAFHNQIIGYSWNQSDERALFERAQASWQNARALTQTNDYNDYSVDEAKEEIRETLTAILSESLAASSSTTSTEVISDEQQSIDATTIEE